MTARRSPASPELESTRISPLDAGTQSALDAMVDALTAVDPALALTAAMLEAPLDMLLPLHAGTEPLADALADAARCFVHRAVGGEHTPEGRRLPAAVERLREATAGLADAPGSLVDPAAAGSAKERRDDALVDLGTLLREVALEEIDVDFYLATQQEDGATVLVWHPVPADTAHVWLLSRLYPRIEASIFSAPLLALERRASRWWFERWSSRTSRSEEWSFTWSVREQEYSLVERATLELDEPIVDALLHQEFFARIPARQRRMAEALSRSWLSVFRVKEHDGGRLVLEDAADGRRHRVHEHNPELRYPVGFLGFGRLLPLDDDHCLRSPGMAFLQDSGGGLVERLLEALEVGGESIGLGPAMESVLTLTQGREKLPRHVLPADSPTEARLLVQQMQTALRENDLVEDVPADEAPDELRAAIADHPSEAVYVRMAVDQAVGEWMTALGAQGGKGGKVPERKRRKKKRKGR